MNKGCIEPTSVGVRHILIQQASILIGIIFLCIIVGLSAIYALNWPPSIFPTGSTFVIEEGRGLGEIGALLKEKGYIKSVLFFKLAIRTSYAGLSIEAGEYRFETPHTTIGVIDVLKQGAERSVDLSFTFPEGFSLYDMYRYTNGTFTAADFKAYEEYEGYLFPDTYFMSPRSTAAELIGKMRREYEEKLEPLRARIEASPFTEKEVIILASILEREANDAASMKLVSGILQDRMKEDHPLQVDATFAYILDKTSEELTMDDLEIDSPYNTYTHLGLPPTPIANPGVMAIEAVLEPTPSPYFYYLTGKDGVFHYARTFEEHKQNKERYLR